MNVRTPIRSLAIALTAAGLGAAVSTALAAGHDHDHGPANPRIYHALDALRDAKAELNDARSDFHGHKREAQDAVDHAISELDRIKDW